MNIKVHWWIFTNLAEKHVLDRCNWTVMEITPNLMQMVVKNCWSGDQTRL